MYDASWDDQVLDRAAVLAYYFSFALFPALLFLAALLGLLPVPDLMSELMGYAHRVLPPDAASLLAKTLGEIVAGASGGLLSIGAAAALWSASSGMASIMGALNTVYRIVDPRSWLRQRLIAVWLTVAFSLFVLTALLLLFFGERIGEAVAARLGVGPLFSLVWNIVQWPVVIFLVFTGLALVHYLAPARSRGWHWFTPGAIFTVAAWLTMSFGLRVYVTYFSNYNATYGSIGGVILLMLWIYLSGIVLLLGAEIDAQIERADVLP